MKLLKRLVDAKVKYRAAHDELALAAAELVNVLEECGGAKNTNHNLLRSNNRVPDIGAAVDVVGGDAVTK